MKLSKLIKNLKNYKTINFKDVEVEHITSSSLEVGRGSVFFAYKGSNLDGRDYVFDAVSKGAVAVVTDREFDCLIPQIIVSDSRIATSVLAKEFYKQNKQVKVIGVVGTNGKTTTTFIMQSILRSAGYKVGVIGTLGIFYGNHKISPELTTPDAISLYETLYNMSEEDVDYCVMEVSAHAISQKRCYGIKFESIIFTNCTQDHLDYFKTFDEYEKTKLSLFNCKYSKTFVVNSDSNSGVKILNKNLKNTISYGLNNPADVFAVDLIKSSNKTDFIMNILDELLSVSFNMAGEFNVLNCLGATACARILGVNIDDIKRGINECLPVKGRMQFVENYNGANIYVDFAHTPDGVENTLKAFRQITKNKLYVILGCGGNRDKSKREIMGEIAGKVADFTIITSDNPRYEEPYLIMAEIEKGVRKNSSKYILIENRYIATGYAIEKLSSGDVLAILGKGAEEYQEIMGNKVKYSDFESVKDIIAKIGLGGEFIWKIAF